VSDDETGRPMLTEMAEKLRQARSMDFHGEDHSALGGNGEARVARAPAPAAERRSDDRQARSATDAIRVSTRIDSFERRLFELRVTLDEVVANQLDGIGGGTSRLPSDAEAWIAFAAAAAGRGEDAETQALVADQLLAEYRKRRSALARPS
jgi:hypothetical protein